ncbi:allophanate hydrolase subunit 1 [Staphylococcus pragensis]|uniref:Allophanate hydrolase subunit 1 n=1 Tax=Staphylococcus pragensis TaxID=1611836 RepID=A0A4Z1B3K9_9STAP|nr:MULTISPECIES: allophanate hydrolase subunit 1 [Staphylococcus]RTX90590.1 allophanate hydrolase subunit 1 [Staphylococcus carnosus]TGN28163.1 allophanate hydrolase subunit 1 [Staphylococcus pragensis]GGG89574.1 allophanate hydrolase [Staphylococcus pragensis]
MKIYSQGDQAIVIAIEKDVSQNVTRDLIAVRHHLLEKNLPFITEIVPTESDMMICYDARDMIKHHHITSPFQYMKDLVHSIHKEIEVLNLNEVDSTSHNIPIIYGEEFGPDLKGLLNYYNITEEEFIKLHSGNQYFVSMMGYLPGFPYLTGMNEALYVNHTSEEKKLVRAGSVILEGKKCGIVTTDTYNDWLVIGYTPTHLFNPNQEDFNLLKLGDNVTFQPKKRKEIELGDFKPCQS